MPLNVLKFLGGLHIHTKMELVYSSSFGLKLSILYYAVYSAFNFQSGLQSALHAMLENVHLRAPTVK